MDASLLRWPPGTFDATTDLVGNPTKLNNTFTFGDHPYAWTGIFLAGPFKGLTAITSHVHAIGSDGLSQAASSAILMGIDTEVYLGALLQHAAREIPVRPSARPNSVRVLCESGSDPRHARHESHRRAADLSQYLTPV